MSEPPVVDLPVVAVAAIPVDEHGAGAEAEGGSGQDSLGMLGKRPRDETAAHADGEEPRANKHAAIFVASESLGSVGNSKTGGDDSISTDPVGLATEAS